MALFYRNIHIYIYICGPRPQRMSNLLSNTLWTFDPFVENIGQVLMECDPERVKRPFIQHLILQWISHDFCDNWPGTILFHQSPAIHLKTKSTGIHFSEFEWLDQVDRVLGPKYQDNVIKWRHFPRCWLFVKGNHRSPVDFPHRKIQWRRALMFSLIWARTNGWANNRDVGDLRRHHGHYDVTVMDSQVTLQGWF